MAELAFVFHWAPAVMDEMEVSELIDWRNKAADIWNKAHSEK
jgi:hypothetical protein